MNRDWFARTQPETDGKLELLRRFPPMLYIDAHEFGYSDFLFPPHADPEYHETPDTVHDWIFDDYSPAIVAEFDREKLNYHHGAPYDFFASIFGDTVPGVGFHAAGMTFEKDNRDLHRATAPFQQFLAMWASVFRGRDGRHATGCASGTTPTSTRTRRASAGELAAQRRLQPEELALPGGARTNGCATTSCRTGRTASTSSTPSSDDCSGWTSTCTG